MPLLPILIVPFLSILQRSPKALIPEDLRSKMSLALPKVFCLHCSGMPFQAFLVRGSWWTENDADTLEILVAEVCILLYLWGWISEN